MRSAREILSILDCSAPHRHRTSTRPSLQLTTTVFLAAGRRRYGGRTLSAQEGPPRNTPWCLCRLLKAPVTQSKEISRPGGKLRGRNRRGRTPGESNAQVPGTWSLSQVPGHCLMSLPRSTTKVSVYHLRRTFICHAYRTARPHENGGCSCSGIRAHNVVADDIRRSTHFIS